MNEVLNGQPHPDNFTKVAKVKQRQSPECFLIIFNKFRSSFTDLIQISQIWRYTLDMENWTLKNEKDLFPYESEDIIGSFEFCNINPEYQGKKYK